MKKIIYIALAAAVLLLLAGCGSSKKETPAPQPKQIEGEWKLSSWNGFAPQGSTTYLALNTNKTFELYLQSDGTYPQRFTGNFQLSKSTLSGTYTDNTAWEDSYKTSVDESGNTLTITSLTNTAQVSVYTKTTIPASVKTPALTTKLQGEWQLTSWNGSPADGFDAYLAFKADSSFEIYQRIEEISYQKYTGSYLFSGIPTTGTILSGTYSDNTAWGSPYKITMGADGNTVTLTSNTAVSEISVYTRTTIPSSVKAGATVMKARSGGFRLL